MGPLVGLLAASWVLLGPSWGILGLSLRRGARVLGSSSPSYPCESLSEADPAQCPMTYGASGAAINTAKTCVYSSACAASGGLDCFERTGCKYSDGFGIELSANFSFNTATASASTLAYPSPTQCGAPGEPKTCSADSNCQTSVAWPFPGSDWVGPCSKCDRGYGCAVVHDCEGSGVDCIGPCACEGI